MYAVSKQVQREEWLATLRLRLEETAGEVAVFERSIDEWERLYGKWPGEGYARVMRAQAAKLEKDIAFCEAKLAGGRS